MCMVLLLEAMVNAFYQKYRHHSPVKLNFDSELMNPFLRLHEVEFLVEKFFCQNETWESVKEICHVSVVVFRSPM